MAQKVIIVIIIGMFVVSTVLMIVAGAVGF